MIRKYPVERPTSAPSTGTLLYEHLMRNIAIPAQSNHLIWYEGEKAKLEHPDKFAFRGNIPFNKTLELITLNGEPIAEGKNARPTGNGTVLYTFRRLKKIDPVLVKDLSDKARNELGIPANAKAKDKVFNPNFKVYDKLDELTKISNELAALSLPKSISSYFGGQGKLTYSERDVLGFLSACFKDLNSPEMIHVMHGNHLAWAALAYIREKGNVEGDIMTEFHAQNPTDFYVKDLGTVLPSMYFALANLGQDPIVYHNKLDVEVWGAEDAAKYMRQFMPKKGIVFLDQSKGASDSPN